MDTYSDSRVARPLKRAELSVLDELYALRLRAGVAGDTAFRTTRLELAYEAQLSLTTVYAALDGCERRCLGRLPISASMSRPKAEVVA